MYKLSITVCTILPATILFNGSPNFFFSMFRQFPHNSQVRLIGWWKTFSDFKLSSTNFDSLNSFLNDTFSTGLLGRSFIFSKALNAFAKLPNFSSGSDFYPLWLLAAFSSILSINCRMCEHCRICGGSWILFQCYNYNLHRFYYSSQHFAIEFIEWNCFFLT